MTARRRVAGLSIAAAATIVAVAAILSVAPPAVGAPLPPGPPPAGSPAPAAGPAPAPSGRPAPPPASGPRLPDVLSPLTGIGAGIAGLAGAAARQTASTVLDAFSQWVADGTATLLGTLAAAIDKGTAPAVTAGWLQGDYADMARIAALLGGPLLFAAAVTAIIRQDAGVLARAIFVHLPVAAVGTAAAMTVTRLALGATDELCSIVTRGTGATTASLFDALIQVLSRTGSGGGGFALMLVCVFLLIAGFLLTLELIMRSAAIYVAMLFLPLTLAGLLWPSTARWSRRLVEMLAVLILSKFVVVAIIAMAAAALAGSLSGGGLSGLLAGAALLLLAGTAPFTLLRMAPVLEAAAVGHLEGAGRHVVPSLPVDTDYVARKLLPPPGGAPAGRAAVATDEVQSFTPTVGMSPDGTQEGSDHPHPVPGAGAPEATGAVGVAAGVVAGAVHMPRRQVDELTTAVRPHRDDVR